MSIGKKVLMQCGHSANAKNAKGKPACAICVGIDPGAEVVAKPGTELIGRKAHCAYERNCQSIVHSSTNLAFFEYRPDKRYDLYYCGCRGWD